MADREPRRSHARRVAWASAAAGLAALLLAACSFGENPRFVRLDEPLPRIEGPTLDGGRLGPTHYAGKVVLVNFWASWCAPCKREQPALEALWRRLRGSGEVAFVGVDHLDRRPEALDWIERYEVTYPSIWDPEGAIAQRLGVPYLPTTILADASGRMRYRLIGEQREAVLARLIERLRAEARER